MSDKIRVRVVREYAVDVQDWVLEYNLSGDFDEVREDIGRYLSSDTPSGVDFPAYHSREGIIEQTSRVVEFL